MNENLRPPQGDSLEQLRARLARFAADRDWDQFHSPKNLSMALIAEAAELVGGTFQWLTEAASQSLGPGRTRRSASGTGRYPHLPDPYR